MLTGRFVIADIEATGLGPEREMIELALITIDEGRVVDVFETLLNPLAPLPERITELTQIYPRELEQAPKFYEIASSVEEKLRRATFVSHNVAFDWPMLETAFTRMGLAVRPKTLCTLRLAQELLPGLRAYTLEDLCKFFNIKMASRHRALPDARATFALFKELMELRGETRPAHRRYFLPEHTQYLKDLPAQAGVMEFRGADRRLLRLESSSDLRATFERLLEVRPENRELLESCSEVRWEVTGSPLLAAFLRARHERPFWRWMITVGEDPEGRPEFKKEAFRPDGRGRWFFQGHAEAKKKWEELQKSLPQQKYVWQDGGPSKDELVERTQAVERLLRETRFPSENLLLWGPGRTTSEWSYVLVRQGDLVGWGYSLLAPEEALEKPLEVIQHRSGKIPTERQVALRYFREHREDRYKKDQWRALKEREIGP